MEDYKEFTASSIDEAKEMAKDYFNTNEIEFELLPPKFLSMFSGKKSFRINARKSELTSDFYDLKTKAKNVLSELLEKMGLSGNIEDTIENKVINLDITNEDLETIKGRGSDLADSLQHIVSKTLRKDNTERVTIVVDINSYKSNREDFIKTLAERACSNVQKTGRPYILKPLNPRERRLVHIYVAANGFASESIGDSRFKKIKIFTKPKEESVTEE